MGRSGAYNRSQSSNFIWAVLILKFACMFSIHDCWKTTAEITKISYTGFSNDQSAPEPPRSRKHKGVLLYHRLLERKASARSRMAFAPNGAALLPFASAQSRQAGSPETELRASNSCPKLGYEVSAFSGSIDGRLGSSRSYTSCSWMIAPPNATIIHLKFLYFQLEICCNLLEIYDCFDSFCTNKALISAPLSGNGFPPAITSTTGRIQLILTSSFRSATDGFLASYETLCPSNTYGQVKLGTQDCKPCRSSCPVGKQLYSSCGTGSVVDTTNCECPAGYFSTNTSAACVQCSIICPAGNIAFLHFLFSS